MIVDSSKELKGAFMKLVQMLSMRDDILPGEALKVLSVVQSQVPPMEYAEIRAQVKRELGKPQEQPVTLHLDDWRLVGCKAWLGEVTGTWPS